MQRQIWHHQPHQMQHPPEPVQLPFRVELEIVRGQARQRVRSVSSPAFLWGSAEDCDLVLGDPQFPEVHAYIRIAKEGVTVRHLGFAPALTVNGILAGHLPLSDGDRIRTGPFEFLVHIQPPAAGDDLTSSNRPLRLPAALDRVEDTIGNALVQQLLTQIRAEMLPSAAHLKLYIDPELSAAQSASPQSDAPDFRQAYARSS